jgi:hypothetical protein
MRFYMIANSSDFYVFNCSDFCALSWLPTYEKRRIEIRLEQAQDQLLEFVSGCGGELRRLWLVSLYAIPRRAIEYAAAANREAHS